MIEHEFHFENTPSPAHAVAAALVVAGLPVVAAEKFSLAAVEALRVWLWGTPGKGAHCVCDDPYFDRGLEDPHCMAHDYDRLLGGDGNGVQLTPEMERERLVIAAAELREKHGEEIYRRVFAPVIVRILDEIKADEDAEELRP